MKIGLVLVPVALFSAGWLCFMPQTPVDVPREVARATLPCGELLLVQTFTGTTDPYFLRLFFRAKGSVEWTRYLVDNEAPYWWGGIRLNGTRATLTFYGTHEGTFDCNGPVLTVRGHEMPPGKTIKDPFDIGSAR